MMLTVGEAEDWGWAGGCSPLLLFCSGHDVVEVSQGGALVLMANYPVAKA